MNSAEKKYKLNQPVPQGRSYDSLVRHYEAEKALALRLKSADREARKKIYATMYDELFRKVPDHPRLTGVVDPVAVDQRNRAKFKLVKEYLSPDSVAMEFAPGDCAFARYLCDKVKKVITVDISDQGISGQARPENWHQVIYDGYSMEFREKVDLVFSDQFIEHLVPEDVEAHLLLAHSFLKPGGRYVLCTPHAFHGPHDISLYFSNKPEGFHLKEWTYTELGRLLLKSGFSNWIGRRRINGAYRDIGKHYWIAAESFAGVFPYGTKKLLARALVPRHLAITAIA